MTPGVQSGARWSRRAVLGASAAALAACSTDGRSGAPAGPRSTGGASPAPGVPDWSQLARHTRGRLTLPSDRAYDRLRRLRDPRYDDQRPQALLSVGEAADVGTAFAFAQDADLPVAIRSGGHCYAGWSGGGVPPALVLDCRALDAVDLHPDGSATIGPGALLGGVYDRLGGRGRGIAAGSCSTVGFGGLTLGGGVGVLSRVWGLSCDAVTAMEVVTADGRVHQVDADREPDLFFALRGGGGGHVGLVTSFSLMTHAATDVSSVFLRWPLDAVTDVLPVWQTWAPTADRRLWSTLRALGGALHVDGPVLTLSATWTGPDAAVDRALAGLLDQVPAPDVDVRHRRSYRDTMRAFGGSASRTGFGATSHVAHDPLDDTGVAALLEHARAAQGSGLREAGVSLDALGGAVADLAPDETAFVHRTALATVQYTATYDAGPPDPADAYVRGFRAAMTPHWGETAYVNYADATLADPAAAYFGANAPRLHEVAARYDPDGFFTQPQPW